MDPKGLTPTQRRDPFVRRVVRRWILYAVILLILFVLTTALQAVWPPLALAIPGLAAVLLVVLVGRALAGHRWEPPLG
jgi:hypothetical protein